MTLHRFGPYQQLTRLLGGEVSTVEIRDPCDGSVRYAVGYESKGAAQWLSDRRFENVDQAMAAAATLADFLGAEHRR